MEKVNRFVCGKYKMVPPVRSLTGADKHTPCYHNPNFFGEIQTRENPKDFYKSIDSRLDNSLAKCYNSLATHFNISF